MPRPQQQHPPSYRQRPGRTLVLLLLVGVFCTAALVAGGALDTRTDLSDGSTAILTPDEAAARAEADAENGTAPLALIGLLLLVGGLLLLQFALPSRREKRRAARAEAAPAPPPVPVRHPDADPTLVLAPLPPPVPAALPAPAPVPAPVREFEVLIDPAGPARCGCGALLDPRVPAPTPVVDDTPAPTQHPSPQRRVGARMDRGAAFRISPVALVPDRKLASISQFTARTGATPPSRRAQEGTVRMAERFGGHQVPQDAKEQTAATLRATPGILGMPSDAERSRTLMAIGTGASLATMSTECPGFPFGSLVAYSVDEVGRPILCLSALAEHSRNMAADPRASLMVTAPEDGVNDRLALSRVTLVGEMKVLEGAEREAALSIYEAGHPSAFYVRFDDFSAYRLEVHSIRYVGGFGRMSWVTAEEYAAAEPDPLLGGSAKRIIEHMNDDHGDALVAYCKVFARYEGVESARMIGVDRYGMDIMATMAGGEQRAARVSFTAPVSSVDEVRGATIQLLEEARAQLSTS